MHRLSPSQRSAPPESTERSKRSDQRGRASSASLAKQFLRSETPVQPVCSNVALFIHAKPADWGSRNFTEARGAVRRNAPTLGRGIRWRTVATSRAMLILPRESGPSRRPVIPLWRVSGGTDDRGYQGRLLPCTCQAMRA